jgi:hypothetical protein
MWKANHVGMAVGNYKEARALGDMRNFSFSLDWKLTILIASLLASFQLVISSEDESI